MKKKAFITGITGQDGSYLAELLLEKNYEVHGMIRRTSCVNTKRIEHLIKDDLIFLHYGDLSDSNVINKLIFEIQPDEIYNLGAQSHVGVSFENPVYTSQINGISTLYILEAIKNLNLINKTKFYQASTSELYGLTQEISQNEKTPFYPKSPYAVSKLYAYWMTVNYREAYNIFACNGILFNHESERRGEEFVTRKITKTLSKIFYGLEKCLYIGNLNALRDWGCAKDFVYMQWLMLQQEKAEDYVISTGVQKTVRDFINIAVKNLGIELEFIGSGLNEEGVIKKIKNKNNYLKEGDVIVRVDKKYFRPCEVNTLLGDSSKAKDKLFWKAKTSVEELCKEMMDNDLKIIKGLK